MNKTIEKINGEIIETITPEPVVVKLQKDDLKIRRAKYKIEVDALTVELAKKKAMLDECEANCEAMEVDAVEEEEEIEEVEEEISSE